MPNTPTGAIFFPSCSKRETSKERGGSSSFLGSTTHPFRYVPHLLTGWIDRNHANSHSPSCAKERTVASPPPNPHLTKEAKHTRDVHCETSNMAPKKKETVKEDVPVLGRFSSHLKVRPTTPPRAT